MKPYHIFCTPQHEILSDLKMSHMSLLTSCIERVSWEPPKGEPGAQVSGSLPGPYNVLAIRGWQCSTPDEPMSHQPVPGCDGGCLGPFLEVHQRRQHSALHKAEDVIGGADSTTHNDLNQDNKADQAQILSD